MSSFLERLYREHNVRVNISGKGNPPEFDELNGSWKTATKAQHSLLLMEDSSESRIVCRIPSAPKDRFRLGQINFTSLFPGSVVAFRLWCAAKAHDDELWTFLSRISWHLAFRLLPSDVENIRRTFQGHSQSGIEFRFTAHTGQLEVYTQRQTVPCRYVQGGLILNYDESMQVGFGTRQYGEFSQVIRSFIRVSPVNAQSSEVL